MGLVPPTKREVAAAKKADSQEQSTGPTTGAAMRVPGKALHDQDAAAEAFAAMRAE